MRIAYFTDTFYPQINGVTNTLDKLAGYLESKEIKHVFFAPDYPGSSLPMNARNVRRFKSVSFPLYPECRLSIPFYSNICSLADKFNPDVVHLVTPLGIGTAGLRYARERGIPVVASYHTNFNVYLKYYNLEYMENLIWNYFRWFHGFSGMNFCPSTDTLEILRANGVGNLKIWPRGIDTEIFSPCHRNKRLREELGLEERLAFLYVGRLAAEKDLDILVESIKKVICAYGGKARFVIAGDGPYASFMKNALPEDTVFTGYVKGRELSELYASCDVFLFPSSTETFGNVVLEAMASGLPVIAANSGGVKDSVKNGFNGLLCEPRNAESFFAAAGACIENHELLDRMSRSAREHTLSKSWDGVFGQLVSDYREALEQHYKSIEETA